MGVNTVTENSAQASSVYTGVPPALQPLVPYLNWLVSTMAGEASPAAYTANLQCVSVEQAAALLVLTPDTIREKIKAGMLPAIKHSKNYSIRCADLQAYLQQCSTRQLPPAARRRARGTSAAITKKLKAV